ncbi:MFS transporter [Rhodopila sp.]|uniref:MFS transporter n=1 Tax=Rhodopila sp. TaxID=2480087 RepID=UPI003D144A63
MANDAPAPLVRPGATSALAVPSKRRFVVMALLFVTVVITYLDRSNLSIAAPGIAREFALSPVQMGLLFSAFGWTYTPLQIPGGWLTDRIRPRTLYTAALVLWSAATLSIGVASGFTILIVLRMLVGVWEVPSFLINNRVATTWFGEGERATCIAVYTAAEYVGLAFLTPVLAWIAVTFGWPVIFFATGAVGLIWAVIWYRSYHEPTEFPGVNAAEIALIESTGGIPDLSTRIEAHRRQSGITWRDLGVVLGRRKLWGLYLGHFAWGNTAAFFLTWFPTYLVKYRHLDFIKAGIYASLPFLCAVVGVLCSGMLSDWLVRRGVSLSIARKTMIICGLGLSSVIIGANYVSSPALIIMFLALAFLANGLASIHWSLVSATAPERLIGLTSGMFNFAGGLASITGPIVIGFLLQAGSFTAPLVYIACVALLGAGSYIFIVGKLERVAD